MSEVILTLYYPKSGITQVQEYVGMHEAMINAHSHLSAFPNGYGQISEKASGSVVMSHEDLLASLASQRRDAGTDVTVVVEDKTGGFFARLFGVQRNEHQPG